MQTNYTDGRRETLNSLTAQDVMELTERNLNDPTVESFEVTMNRHARRRQAAMGKRKSTHRKAKNRGKRSGW